MPFASIAGVNFAEVAHGIDMMMLENGVVVAGIGVAVAEMLSIGISEEPP